MLYDLVSWLRLAFTVAHGIHDFYDQIEWIYDVFRIEVAFYEHLRKQIVIRFTSGNVKFVVVGLDYMKLLYCIIIYCSYV